jgi:hypothetical protein
MKNLLLFIFVFCNLGANGQQYFPLPTRNAVWKVDNIFAQNPAQVSILKTNYIMNGDTLIGRNTYHKIYSQLFSNPIQYVGAIRENLLKEVYYFAKTDVQESLLYKFGLNTGDSLLIRRNTSRYIKIGIIDSINIGGFCRKRYSITQSGAYEKWIEGIGSDRGLLYPQYGSGMEDEMLLSSFEKDSMVFYNRTNFLIYTICLPSATDELSNTYIDVFPNPAQGLLRFRLGDLVFKGLEVRISDVLGSVLIEKKMDSAELEFEIATDKLVDGVYFYELRCSSGRRGGKFVVQR